MDQSQTKLEKILLQWEAQRPDLDCFCMVVCGEVWHTGNRLMQGLQENLKRFELDFAGLDVLLTLRRNGPEDAMHPTHLAKDMMLSGSGMTARITKLENRGLLSRTLNPKDKRSFYVQLTSEGLALTERLIEGHVEAEQKMLKQLTRDEQETLIRLLTKIAV